MAAKRRRLLIIDTSDAPEEAQEHVKPVLSKQQLHAKAQKSIIDAAERYKYEIGKYEEFEKPIWRRVDRILQAQTQADAEKMAADAEDLGSLTLSVWHKKAEAVEAEVAAIKRLNLNTEAATTGRSKSSSRKK